MNIEITIPSPGESITEVELARWLVKEGDFVEKNQDIAEVESEKATLPLIAPEAGVVSIVIAEGSTAKVGAVACTINNTAKRAKAPQAKKTNTGNEENKSYREAANETNSADQPALSPTDSEDAISQPVPTENPGVIKATPLARKIMEANNITANEVISGIKKITAGDVRSIVDLAESPPRREVSKKKMTQLRKKLSQRLVSARNETALLTTFNEVDMSAINQLRQQYKEPFFKEHNVRLSIMSFFVKAAAEVIKLFPQVNSMIEGDDVITPDYIDICFAVQTDKGLMVPVIRNAGLLPLPEIEKSIALLAEKARTFKISIEEMNGGTFTISNGGVFGSMLSTPIINPPQSAILGMHNIVDRPVAVNGSVEIRPIMYLALSYDHRLIDGKDSVSFLVKVKEFIEDPLFMLYGGKKVVAQQLLGL